MKSPRVVKVAVGRDRDHIVAYKLNILQVVEEAVLGEERGHICESNSEIAVVSRAYIGMSMWFQIFVCTKRK